MPALRHARALTVRSGETFFLDARDSSDPDGDSLSFLWFQYPEVGTFRGKILGDSATNLSRMRVLAPHVNKPETVHFILKVTDKGKPPLTRYERVIVTITPPDSGLTEQPAPH